MSARLHHTVEGPPDAPVLVLSSSLGTTAEMWAPQTAALRDRLRVVTYDTRGHGRSAVPPGPYEIADLGGDVLALLDDLVVERFSFCGLSIGGMTGIWLAANAPHRIDRLVVCSSSAHLPPAEGWVDRAAAVRAAGTTEVVADAVLARWLTPDFAAAHPEEAARLRAMLTATPPEGYAACCGAIERMDLRGDLARIEAPTLVIAAAGDEATPPAHGQAIAAGIEGARLVVLEGAAHIANVQRPDAVTELILDHVDPQETR